MIPKVTKVFRDRSISNEAVNENTVPSDTLAILFEEEIDAPPFYFSIGAYISAKYNEFKRLKRISIDLAYILPFLRQRYNDYLIKDGLCTTFDPNEDTYTIWLIPSSHIHSFINDHNDLNICVGFTREHVICAFRILNASKVIVTSTEAEKEVVDELTERLHRFQIFQ